MIQYLNNANYLPPWQVAHIVHERRQLLSSDDHIKLNFTNQQANKVAHNTARTGLRCSLYGQWLYNLLPPSLLEELDIQNCNHCSI